MRVLENGVYRDMTESEKLEVERAEKPTYRDRVVSRIREKYSVDDELAVLRQRDTKPEEFAEYYNFVENIKSEERGEADV